MATHHIKIDVDVNSQGDANFTYYPAVCRVYNGDQVQWTCNDGPFSVMFKEGTPCNTMDARGSGAAGPFTSPVVTIGNAARGHYHYAVAVYIKGVVNLDAACPELIVN